MRGDDGVQNGSPMGFHFRMCFEGSGGSLSPQNNKTLKADQILGGNYLRLSVKLESSRGYTILQSRTNGEEFQPVFTVLSC